MIMEIILALILGLITGTLTGLIPGIHINLIGIFLISLSTKIIYNIQPIYLVAFITSVAITHTFIDFIPSIFLGCPDTDTELSILPGHKLLQQGEAYKAIILTTYGSLSAIFLLIIIFIPSIKIIPLIYETTKKLIPYMLLIIIAFLIYLEKRKLNSVIVITLTGILGYITLNSEVINNPLLPLLTGLFGSSTLILSIKNKIKIPKQLITKEKPRLIKPLLGAVIAAPLCSFLPSMGSGQAAIIGNTITKNNNQGFLVLLGATNTLVMSFSFISLYIIQRTRTGAALAIQQLIGQFNLNTLLLIITITLLSGIISFFLTKKLAKFFTKKINKINYINLAISTLIILITIITIISGLIGLFIFIISTLTGIYSINLKVRRTNMMGVLMIPTIIFYLIS